MSHRSIQAKKLARLRKLVDRKPLPARIDLVAWLKLRRYARTSGEAEKLILAGKVTAGGRPLGITERLQPKKLPRFSAGGQVSLEMETVPAVAALVDAKYGPEI